MATFTNQNKNYATFVNFLRHGSGGIIENMLVSELVDYTFDSIVFDDGTMLKDLTFNDVVAQSWANQNKNVSSFTLQNRGRQGITWDEATFTWDEASGTWDDPRDTFSLLVKSSASFSLQAKL